MLIVQVLAQAAAAAAPETAAVQQGVISYPASFFEGQQVANALEMLVLFVRDEIAVKNIGNTDAYFVNMPTRPYSHEDPDKYRLPLRNDRIPYAFDDGQGW